jgi:AcrR family transcriptional regulator
MPAMNDVQEKNEHGSEGSRGETAAGRRHRHLREALLAAAERAIAESGLLGLKAREVAREAGCALGAVYTAFADLDALVLAVNARTLDALDAHLRAAASRPEAEPVVRVVALAEAYLDYATRHRPRWAALFAHRMAAGRELPAWYAEKQAELFRHVEGPVAALRPGLDAAGVSCLARTLFSAVHGVVSLGLDEKLAPMPETALRRELRLVAEAMARGLDARA